MYLYQELGYRMGKHSSHSARALSSSPGRSCLNATPSRSPATRTRDEDKPWPKPGGAGPRSSWHALCCCWEFFLERHLYWWSRESSASCPPGPPALSVLLSPSPPRRPSRSLAVSPRWFSSSPILRWTLARTVLYFNPTSMTFETGV